MHLKFAGSEPKKRKKTDVEDYNFLVFRNISERAYLNTTSLTTSKGF